MPKQTKKQTVQKEEAPSINQSHIQAEAEMATESLDRVLNDFVAKTSKSKVAIIIPLFGYWSDIKDNPLGYDTLKATMDRIYTSAHQAYIFFVADQPRTTSEALQALTAKSFAGQVEGVLAPKGATYGEYVREGLRVASTETDARFFVVVNPWLVLQHNAIDVMIDRLNRRDIAVVSGYDVKKDADWEKFNNRFSYRTPFESRELNVDFFGLERWALDMFNVHDGFGVHDIFAKDMWQSFYKKGYEVISSQTIPMYVFDLDWTEYETEDDYINDRIKFYKKWGFDLE